jgi:hypothetical protein
MGKKGFSLADLISSKSDFLKEKLFSIGLKQKGLEKTEVNEIKFPHLTKQNEKDISGSREKRDLVIGFDLGTACTKVVIQDPLLKRAHSIPFSDQSGQSNVYLCPSEIRLSPQNELSLKKKNQSTVIRHFKVFLMDKPNELLRFDSAKETEIGFLELTAAYVALVLKMAKEWFMKENAKVYEGADVYWHLNIGIPSKNYDDKLTKENFRKMALGAWWLSTKNRPITLDEAIKIGRLVHDEKFDPGIHPDYINVVPEVAAQVAGYARSPLREEGLHMLVDIGAVTMDAATFVLSKKFGEDQYAFLVAKVEKFGALELHYHRLDGIKDYLNNWVTECKECFDIFKPVPESCREFLPEFDGLTNIDEEFLREACNPLRRVVAHTKTSRDPNSPKWKEGLPIFLCGGGSQMQFYSSRMIKQVEKELLKNFKWEGFRLSSIPKPTNLIAEGLHPRDYHRLSVAYGLSFLYEDIGMIVPPSEVDDVKKTGRIREYEFISKDQV